MLRLESCWRQSTVIAGCVHYFSAGCLGYLPARSARFDDDMIAWEMEITERILAESGMSESFLFSILISGNGAILARRTST